MTLSEYKKEITAIFHRNTYRGFADWRQCGNLERDLCDFLEISAVELLREGRDKDLFDITSRAFVQWSDTDKDDSNGETQDFVGTVFEIWDRIRESKLAVFPQEKMFDWFVSKMDGSLIDYMEDYLLKYVMDHFKEPYFLEKKLAFLQQRIKDLTERSQEDDIYRYSLEESREMVLRIYSEQNRPIEFIREYAKDLKGFKSKELLADIELQYGNPDASIAIYKELAARESDRYWGRHDYNLKLKDIYKEYGKRTQYEEQLKKLLYLETGSEEILTEYKAIVPSEDWERVRNQLFDSFKPGDYRTLSWFAMEGCYERLMTGVEACGYSSFKAYAKLLSNKYPDRCLKILVQTADTDAAEAKQRKDYQHVARVLRWMKKFPNGTEKAAELAEKYRATYPRRRAMIEELEGI